MKMIQTKLRPLIANPHHSNYVIQYLLARLFSTGQ